MDFSAAQIHSAQLPQIVKVRTCSLSVLVYDSLLTMEAEVRLIWRGKMGFGTLLYVMARYLTFVDVPLVLFCKYSQRTTAIGIAAAETILVLRTWAMWGRNMRILNGLSASTIYSHTRPIDRLPHQVPEWHQITSCYASDTLDRIYTIFG
ncbi:hypothetical protein C8J56DRAFT_922178 [Mycena floridula]|nr:hypothetical protein C8J56DRAFT_922178 [Mycena floridula]